MGNINIGQVGFFGELFLRHAATFAYLSNSFPNSGIINFQVTPPLSKSIGKIPFEEYISSIYILEIIIKRAIIRLSYSIKYRLLLEFWKNLYYNDREM